MRNAVDELVDAYALGAGAWTITPVTRGAMGQIWRLSGGESEWAVKELFFGCDVTQVQREAALREASEGLGIASPRLMANQSGAHVTQVSKESGGNYVKLYDWVEGSEVDFSDPELLSWVGRTLALLHLAKAEANETPDSWYEKCPESSDWLNLIERASRAGKAWTEDLIRFVPSASKLSKYVTPTDPSDLVTSHRDVQPQNVLIGPSGPVLLDWDNTGPTSPDRELASAVYAWSGRNRMNIDSARLLVRAYVASGGPGMMRSLYSFSTLFATTLNFIYVQADCTMDLTATAAQREFANEQVDASLRTIPDLESISQALKAIESEW